MIPYDGKNFYKFDDFGIGDLVFYYDSDGKKNIGLVVDKGSSYLKIHWQGCLSTTLFGKTEMEQWGFGFCKYEDRKKYKELMK